LYYILFDYDFGSCLGFLFVWIFFEGVWNIEETRGD
jgi:hypothetical protein